MYQFPYFKARSDEEVYNFIAQNPLALITGSSENGFPVATKIPMLLEERSGELFLIGHMMRNTDHHLAIEKNPKVLAVFSGPDCYVSASWYTNPHGGSTWNYTSVHASGEIRFTSEEELVDIMKKLTLHFEEGKADSPTLFQNLPNEYTDHMIKMIVGVEIKVEKLENVFKLSQNQNHETYRNIVSKLEERGGKSALVAEELKARESQLFSNSQNGPEIE